jgi:Tfp pilus assembly protein PilF
MIWSSATNSSRGRELVSCLVFFSLAICWPPQRADAQLTSKTLIGSAVKEVGPQYKDVDLAIEAFRKADFATARQLLEKAKREHDELPPLGIMLSQLLFAANQGNLARAELEKVAQADPTDPEPYLYFGEIALQERRISDAELAYVKAASMNESYTANPLRKVSMDERAYSGLAAIAEAREKWEAAKEFLTKAVAADPTDANLSTRLARAMFELGDQRGAYQMLGDLWKNDNSLTRPEVTMGLLYDRAGNAANAEKMLTNASERDQRVETQLAVARWAMENNRLDLAKSASARALQSDDSSVDAHLVAGLIARYTNDLASARSEFEKAHLLSPSNLAAMLQLSVVLTEGDDTRRVAMELAQVGSRIYADLSTATAREAAVTFAWVLYRSDRAAEAARVLEQAVNAGSVSSESSYFAAQILAGLNQTDLARRMIQTALRDQRAFPARQAAEKLKAQLGG